MYSKSILAGTILVSTLAVVHFYPERPTASLTVRTEPIATLLPHAHGAADKISDGHHGVEATSLPVQIKETMWVTEIEAGVTNAPRDIIHHLHLVRILPDGTRDFLRSSLFTFGQDTVSTVRFPAPAGILLRAGEQIAIDAVVHNPVPPLGEGGVYTDVTVDVQIAGVPDGGDRYLPLYFDLTRVTDSTNPDDDDSTFMVPVGDAPFTRRSENNPPGTLGASHRFSSDGWIVYMGAHMHAWEGASEVRAFINDKLIRTFRSRLVDPAVPWGFSTDAMPVYIKVSKGEVLTVSATYTNRNDIPIAGAMGMVGFYYVRDEFTLGSPLYQVSWTVRGWLNSAKDAVLASFR